MLSHTDKVTVKAWSAVKITNFTLQLSGFMMLKRGGGLANCLSLQRNHHTLPVQQQLMCKSLPTNKTTSWNMIKYMTGALGNPKDSWFESTHFTPIQRCPSAKPLALKWKLWRAMKILTKARAAAVSQSPHWNDINSTAITGEECCLMSSDHVLQWSAPRGPKATARAQKVNQAVKLDAKKKQFPVPSFNKKATVPWRINK